ncbi:MAG TPA: hypothetical protein VLF21_00255 [Candidatus Saccharimonadales bacterium]|nr:hypothetical protein [Candidatus Saccharimonadales bacterium]
MAAFFAASWRLARKGRLAYKWTVGFKPEGREDCNEDRWFSPFLHLSSTVTAVKKRVPVSPASGLGRPGEETVRRFIRHLKTEGDRALKAAKQQLPTPTPSSKK